MELSKINQEMIKVRGLGYEIIDGVIYNPDGKILKGHIDKSGYKTFHATKYGTKVMVHKLVAFQKFGNKIFESAVEVRHLDNNALNNKDYNIDIGTHTDNMQDQDEEIRMATAIKASINIRKFTDHEMELIREDYKVMQSYKDVMFRWEISSKGTLHYILNNKYVTTK